MLRLEAWELCTHSLTAAGFALLVAVDEEVSGALGAQGQQETLEHGWQQSEAQEEGPQGGVAQEGLQPKHLGDTHMGRSFSSSTREPLWSAPGTGPPLLSGHLKVFQPEVCLLLLLF